MKRLRVPRMSLPRLRRPLPIPILLVPCVFFSLISVTDAGATLYERPAGIKYDFVYCTEPSKNPLRKRACDTLGLIQCQQHITGNAFLVRSEGSRDVVVTASHALIDRKSELPFKDCKFLLHGTDQGVNVDQAVLLNRAGHTSSRYPDLAAIQLGTSIAAVTWKIPILPVREDSVAELLSERDARFSLIAVHPTKRVTITTAYDCAPVPKKPGHRKWKIVSELNHNCPVLPGFSGGPGMTYLGSSGQYVAICVGHTELGPRERLRSHGQSKYLHSFHARLRGDSKSSCAR